MIYTTPRLTKPIRFAGPLQAELWVSADVVDADWVVTLVDVWPNGFAQNLATGILRSSARESESTLSPLVPGNLYRLIVDIGHAAAKIEVNHLLRLEITGSHFPLYDRNTHTGKSPFGSEVQLANQTVFHDDSRPSSLLLPVIQ